MSRSGGPQTHPKYTIYAAVVGRLLQGELDRAGVTPYRLAQKTGYHRANLSYILNGKLLPSPATLLLLARELSIPVSRLLPRRAP